MQGVKMNIGSSKRSQLGLLANNSMNEMKGPLDPKSKAELA
jgi:hypothetical protein